MDAALATAEPVGASADAAPTSSDASSSDADAGAMDGASPSDHFTGEPG